MQARVNAQSQAHRLHERLGEAAVSHGASVRADLRSVRVTALVGTSDGLAFFCNMEPVRVREVLSRGDGGPLPQGVELAGLEVPAAGLYDILNAHVSSNGELRVVVDAASRVEAVAAAPGGGGSASRSIGIPV